MHKASALLCLLALAVAQVPLLACASECQDVVVSAAGSHTCHGNACEKNACGTRQRHALAPALGHRGTHRHVGDCCGHSHAPLRGSTDSRGNTPAPEQLPQDEEHGLHEVIQISVVGAGIRLVLPEHTVIGPVIAADPRMEKLPTAQSMLEAAHLAEPDPVPVPPPASVRLLL